MSLDVSLSLNSKVLGTDYRLRPTQTKQKHPSITWIQGITSDCQHMNTRT